MRALSGASRQSRIGRNLSLFLAFLFGQSTLYGAEGLQTFLSHLMMDQQGAVIVSDPRTGRILSICNSRLAFQEAYPPGSTAKLVISAAALQESVIAPSETIQCRRIPRLLGDAYHCSHPPADRPFDLAAALANSCNYFFSELSSRLSGYALARWYELFGFGSTEGAGEDSAPGIVRIGSTARDKALAALGEQSVTATPAQVLLAYSAIAAQGREFGLIRPSEQRVPFIARIVPLREGNLAALARGLRECVETGMCRGAAVPGVPVAGKTGTAAALDGSGVTHAWFVGYAPVNSPEVAVVVFLKRGTGAGKAAPLAGRILEEYFAEKTHAR